MKRRICFATVQWPPELGGVANSARRVALGLALSGFEMHVFTKVAGEAEGTVDCEHSNLHVHRVRGGTTELAEAILAADRHLQFDLFHGFYLTAAFACIEVAKRGRRPLIASIRGLDGLGLRDVYSRQVLEHCSWLTSVSTDSLKRANEVTDVSYRSSFIPNGIDLSPFQRWTITGANQGVVGTLAKFRKKKNPQLLVEAYSRLRPESRRKLLLIGDFARNDSEDRVEAARFEQLPALRSLGDEVERIGDVPPVNVPALLLGFNVFVLSSDHEGLPNTILEAAGAGLPIVATAVDGVKDILRSEESALLVAPNQPIEMACAIQRILDDTTLAIRIGNAARVLAERFSVETERRTWVELYTTQFRLPRV